jgi:hypothetical protein
MRRRIGSTFLTTVISPVLLQRCDPIHNDSQRRTSASFESSGDQEASVLADVVAGILRKARVEQRRLAVRERRRWDRPVNVAKNCSAPS